MNFVGRVVGRIAQPFSYNAVPPQALTRSHIYAVDLIRIVVVTLVVAIHVISQGPSTVFIGAWHTVLHVNREIFLMISAFVLTYSYGLRVTVKWWNFFRRRYLLILAPYIAWTSIYTLIGGHSFTSVFQYLATTVDYLTDGLARYNLYFMLILLQLYLIFPLLRWMMASLNRRQHLLLLGGSALLQAFLLWVIEFSLGHHGIFGFWLTAPDPWIMSYPFYVIAGVVGAWYYHELLDFVERNLKLLVWTTLGSVALAMLIYFAQLRSGMPIESADTTFQPVVMLQSTALALTLLALGRRWELGRMRWRSRILKISGTSYGVFLVHPLIIQILMIVLPAIGLQAALGNGPVAVLVQLFIGVPLIAVLSNALVLLAQRTPLSLPLTGKPRDREPSVAKPTEALAAS
jgi:peptidoglycan/LPS O-acetylase OafA/YrhL